MNDDLPVISTFVASKPPSDEAINHGSYDLYVEYVDLEMTILNFCFLALTDRRRLPESCLASNPMSAVAA